MRNGFPYPMCNAKKLFIMLELCECDTLSFSLQSFLHTRTHAHPYTHSHTLTHTCTPTPTHTPNQSGEECMILPTVSNDDAQKLFPKGFKTAQVPSGKSYMRLTPQPE